MGQEGSCLTESGVIRFLEGELPGQEREVLERHVDTCSVCPQLLAAAGHESGVPSGELKERMRPQVLIPGVVLAGRYNVRRFLGSGAMGEVHEAEDQLLGTTVALKTLTAGLAGDEAALSRLKREVAAAHRVTHPNVCRVFDLGADRGHEQLGTLLFLTMEYLPGTTLASFLQARGPLSPERALPLLSQLADGLAAAHAAGIIHRDLKPENVMLIDQADGAPRAVITDFGLAGTVAPDGVGLLPGSGFSGTAMYAAPERMAGNPATSASDVYSFGLVAYEMLFGRYPALGGTRLLRTIDAHGSLPAAWKHLLRRALRPEPSERFAHGGALASALRSPAMRRPGRWRLLLGAVGGAAVLTAALGATRARQDPPPQPQPQAITPAARAVEVVERVATVRVASVFTTTATDTEPVPVSRTRAAEARRSRRALTAAGGPAPAVSAAPANVSRSAAAPDLVRDVNFHEPNSAADLVNPF